MRSNVIFRWIFGFCFYLWANKNKREKNSNDPIYMFEHEFERDLSKASNAAKYCCWTRSRFVLVTEHKLTAFSNEKKILVVRTWAAARYGLFVRTGDQWWLEHESVPEPEHIRYASDCVILGSNYEYFSSWSPLNHTVGIMIQTRFGRSQCLLLWCCLGYCSNADAKLQAYEQQSKQMTDRAKKHNLIIFPRDSFLNNMK